MTPMLFKALEATLPFIRCVTPYNPSTPRQAALAVTLTLNLSGNLHGASIALSQGGIDTDKGLLNVPAEAGYRAFDVFYYLLNSGATPAEREFLSLKSPDSYKLLSRSGTYQPPSYLINGDDAAAADDFRDALKQIGIKGSAHRNLISTLAGLLKLGNTFDYNIDEDAFDDIIEDASGLLGIEPEVLATQCSTEDRQTFIGGLYEALVDWVITKANTAIAAEMGHLPRAGSDESSSEGAPRTPNTEDDNEDTVCITVLEISDPDLGKALALRGIFDDTMGINSEMKQDGLEVSAAGSSVLREMQNAVTSVAPDLGIMSGPAGRERLHVLEKREEVLEKLALAAEEEGFLKKLLFPVEGEGINLGRNARFDLPALVGSSRAWYHLSVHPTDESPPSLAGLPSITSAWSAGCVSRQLRAWRLPEWANRRNKNLDFTADFDHDEFVQRYSVLGCQDGKEGIESWLLERGWSNGEVVVGHERVWMHESAWWEAETMIDNRQAPGPAMGMGMGLGAGNFMASTAYETGYSANTNGSGYFGQSPFADASANESNEGLLGQRNRSQATLLGPAALGLAPGSRAPSATPSQQPRTIRQPLQGDYGLGAKGDDNYDQYYYNSEGEYVGALDAELADGKKIEEEPVTKSRRLWVAAVWAVTFWIPSPFLSLFGRMKRPDVRMAWREKFVLVLFIVLINAFIIFWIVFFGKIICPKSSTSWNMKELATHQGDNDFWVSIHGKVYDISKFWKLQHSDSTIETTKSNMEQFGGANLDEYFVAPLIVTCPGLVTDKTLRLTSNTTVTDSTALHTSGYYQADTSSALANVNWYYDTFTPKIKEYYKGQLVWEKDYVYSQGQDGYANWVIYNTKVYDLTDYYHTLDLMDDLASYKFLDTDLTAVITDNPGEDITEKWNKLFKQHATNATKTASLENSLNCIDNTFYKGIKDFRYSPRCQANNWILLAFTIILCAVIAIKFLAALQFGSKKRPAPQDKFVICQVPAYTEGEDSIRKALDSLTALQYDNKRKLICVICDGLITGEGNDRPTPKIVLDILGVDPKIDPPALAFKSVGQGSEQLNYGKIYSGLYEFEGNVVPYLVVVKVGKESERKKTKPGNRGKRDSQILLMSFLNRVHHRSPMSPLELEMFHQINNIIGVDPELYEYMLMVDADTCVREDSLNRLVAACANDAKIAGICGETSLQNEERSWWTMIQVYEYFISHNLAKAFESLFGSVTCLPGW